MLIGQPVGVSLKNGEGGSGVLCSLNNNTVVLQEYMYRNQYAAEQYPFHMID